MLCRIPEFTKLLLAVLIVIMVGVCIWAIFYYTLPTGGSEILSILIGYMTASFQQVYGYYFGSSDGSTRKTEIDLQKSKEVPNVEKSVDVPITS